LCEEIAGEHSRKDTAKDCFISVKTH